MSSALACACITTNIDSPLEVISLNANQKWGNGSDSEVTSQVYLDILFTCRAQWPRNKTFSKCPRRRVLPSSPRAASVFILLRRVELKPPLNVPIALAATHFRFFQAALANGSHMN